MDKTGADFNKAVESIRERLQAAAVPVQIPIGAEAELAGVVDLVEQQAVIYDGEDLGAKFDFVDIPAELKDEAAEARTYMIEALAETDDNIMEKYLAGTEISVEELKVAIRAATLKAEIFPVFAGSAFKNKGVQPLLDAVIDYLPSPLEVPAVMGSPIGATEEQ